MALLNVQRRFQYQEIARVRELYFLVMRVNCSKTYIQESWKMHSNNNKPSKNVKIERIRNRQIQRQTWNFNNFLPGTDRKGRIKHFYMFEWQNQPALPKRCLFLSPHSMFTKTVTWSWPRHNDNFNGGRTFFSTNDFEQLDIHIQRKEKNISTQISKTSNLSQQLTRKGS